jgi:hypothetical protein
MNKMTTTLNNAILRVTRRTVKGFTVGEIFDRLSSSDDRNTPYNSVRARVYELAAAGKLAHVGERRDPVSGRESKVFVRAF